MQYRELKSKQRCFDSETVFGNIKSNLKFNRLMHPVKKVTNEFVLLALRNQHESRKTLKIVFKEKYRSLQNIQTL